MQLTEEERAKLQSLLDAGCWGEGPERAICETAPVIDTRLRGTGERMSFCHAHFWAWVQKSLVRRNVRPASDFLAIALLEGKLSEPFQA